eukprot:764898-Hanusia_phi.AAC.13
MDASDSVTSVVAPSPGEAGAREPLGTAGPGQLVSRSVPQFPTERPLRGLPFSPGRLTLLGYRDAAVIWLPRWSTDAPDGTVTGPRARRCVTPGHGLDCRGQSELRSCQVADSNLNGSRAGAAASRAARPVLRFGTPKTRAREGNAGTIGKVLNDSERRLSRTQQNLPPARARCAHPGCTGYRTIRRRPATASGSDFGPSQAHRLRDSATVIRGDGLAWPFRT